MIVGIGTDILKIGNLHPEYLKDGDPFLKMTFSPKEIDAARKRQNPIYYFATRFAGKEAVFKTLGISPEHVKLAEIEILNDENGVPRVQLYGNLLEEAEKKGIQTIFISLSYEEEYAAAFAVAE